VATKSVQVPPWYSALDIEKVNYTFSWADVLTNGRPCGSLWPNLMRKEAQSYSTDVYHKAYLLPVCDFAPGKIRPSVFSQIYTLYVMLPEPRLR
jgi:hypothetical protein